MYVGETAQNYKEKNDENLGFHTEIISQFLLTSKKNGNWKL